MMLGKRFKSRWILFIGLATASLLLGGCEEEVKSTTSLTDSTQGSPVSPISITLPYNGTVGAGSSYYVVTGLAPSAAVTIDMTGLNANADLRLYTNPDFSTGAAPCLPQSGAANESCTGTTDGSGQIFIQVVNVDTGVTTFTLDFPPINEGAPGTPVDITVSVPYSGQVAATGNSYYVLTGLTPVGLVEVTISGLTQDVNLDVWSDAAFSVSECFSIRFGTRTDSCVAIANGAGRVYIQITDIGGAGGTYTIDFSLPPAPATEGTIPLPIVANSADLQHNGQVGTSTQISFYKIVGLALSTLHTVKLYNLTDNADITVYSTADFITTFECSSPQLGRTSESCPATSNGAGELYIQVESFAAGGSYFSLNAF